MSNRYYSVKFKYEVIIAYKNGEALSYLKNFPIHSPFCHNSLHGFSNLLTKITCAGAAR